MKIAFTFFVFVYSPMLLIFSPVLSQDITFNRFTSPDPEGNSIGTITGITQDRQGNMWFASSGLFRYDGYKFTSFKHNALKSNFLAGSRIESIYADSNGIIWAGTINEGLDRLDPATGIFTHYRHDPQNPYSISGDTVTVVTQDHEGVFWVGTMNGLNRFDPVTGKFIHYLKKKDDPESLSNDQVRAIYEDHQGTLWIGCGSPFNQETPEGEGGLNRFNKKTGKFTRYLHNPNDPHSLADNHVRAIFEDSHGTFWVGTAGDGLHTMDRSRGVFDRHAYDPSHPEQLSRPPVKKRYPWAVDHITFITEDAAGAVWIGTFENGLNRYDYSTHKIMHYGSETDSANSFKDNSGWTAYTSRDGILWISTWEQNLFLVNVSHSNIPHYRMEIDGYPFLEDKDSVLWIGTNSGLVRKDRRTDILQRFSTNIANPPGKTGNPVLALENDAENNLWVGTFGDGVCRFDQQKQSFTYYRHSKTDERSLVSDTVNAIHLDKSKNILWIATDAGLDKMNVNTGTFTHYRIPSVKSNDNRNIFCIMQDKQQKLWLGMGSDRGIFEFDPPSGKFKNYLKGDYIYSILQDHEGTIWAGSSTGLYRYNTEKEDFSSFEVTGTDFGLVVNLLEDKQNNLWFCSYSGIIKFNTRRNESVVYGKNFGVNGSNLTAPSGYQGMDGQLYFGNLSGYYAFHPQKLMSAKPPLIVIDNLRLGNQQVQQGKNRPLPQPLWKSSDIHLTYDQNVFSLEFNAIDYSGSERPQVLYKLENYDNEWRIGGDRRAYYFNVPAGKYIFKIKATNNGAWAEKELNITITPPWWQTWWAWCIYGLLFVAAAYSVHRFQKRRLLQRERERARVREMAQAKEIEKAYNELKTTQAQLIQSEKMASLGELTAGIAHEIQNPLNFVNNFSEVNRELIEELKEEAKSGHNNEVIAIADDISANEEKINHHGKRADAIVKGMLQHSRSSSSAKEPADINALADEYLRLTYQGFRAKDKTFSATLKKDFDESIEKINIVPQDIGRVLLNLYNNAFYTVIEKKKLQGESYEPAVSISTKKLNGKIEIRVRDNGNGIPQKVLDKIFQPFFTTKPTGQGTGLGLSLSYDIIKAHGGEIKVETKDNEGAAFTIILFL